jgi:DHA1 family multidrug resistance protein-like MFS transporter
VVAQFGASPVAATLGLTLFVAGYGIGPMIWALMSEIPQLGRNPVYIGTLVVFVFLQFAVIYAKNFGMLLAFRFLTGFFGSLVLATGGASLGDMYAPSKRAYAIAIWGQAAVAGSTLGPLIGSFAVEVKGWTWTIWELMWLSGFAFVMMIFFLPETSSANILYRRPRRLRQLTNNERLKCEPEIAAEHMTGKDIVMMTLVRPLSLNFTEPICFCLNLYIALIYGLLYVWFESFVIVFVDTYNFTLGEEGLSFLGIFIGTLIVIPPFFLYLRRVQ